MKKDKNNLDELNAILNRIVMMYDFIFSEGLTLTTKDGTTLSIALVPGDAINAAEFVDYPIQVVLSISLHGRNLFTWGCWTGEQNAMVLAWFNRLRNQVINNHLNQMDLQAKAVKSYLMDSK